MRATRNVYIYTRRQNFSSTIPRRAKTIAGDFSSAAGINHRQNSRPFFSDGRIRAHVMRARTRAMRAIVATRLDRRVLNATEASRSDLSIAICWASRSSLNSPSPFFALAFSLFYIVFLFDIRKGFLRGWRGGGGW